MADKKRGLSAYGDQTAKSRLDKAIAKSTSSGSIATKVAAKPKPKTPVSKPSRGGLNSEEIWLKEQLAKARARSKKK